MYQSYADDIRRDDKPRRPAQKVWAAVFAAAAILLIILQIVYFIYNKKSGYEYIADWMLYAVNAVILICAFLYAFFMLRGRKAPLLAAAVVLAVLFCANIALMALYGFGNTSVITLSPDVRHITVLKQDNETGKVTVYRNSILLFARRYEQFPETVTGDIKTQWLNSDVCAVTYRDDENNLHQYVCTYGDRAYGSYYYEVANVIRGKWAFESHNTDGMTLTADNAGITLKTEDSEQVYAYGDCVQFGTLALVLCRNGKPEWTIALNEDCAVVSGLRILDDGGTLTLCAVSRNKTAPLVYFRTYNPLAEALASQKRGAAAGSATPTASPQPTQSISSGFSGLTKYSSVYSVMDLQTDSTDVFEVGRLAFIAGHKQTGAASQDAALQITRMTLLAGDINEFLIEIKASGSSGIGTALQDDWTFRVKKSDGAFGAVHVGGTLDAAQGLTVLNPPQEKDTSGDPAYFLYIMASPTPEEEQQGQAAARLLADTLAKSPKLSDFTSQQGLVKVKTDSTDLFMVTRLALEENEKQFAVNGFDDDVQITRIMLLAGDENEFLAKVYADETVSNETGSEPAQILPSLRIKKGDGVYLAMVTGYDEVNAAGLNVLDPPQVKDTSQDADYHFFVPAE